MAGIRGVGHCVEAPERFGGCIPCAIGGIGLEHIIVEASQVPIRIDADIKGNIEVRHTEAFILQLNSTLW